MTEWYHDAKISLDILDEILFRDPPDATHHTDTTDGVTSMLEAITFADGSRLSIKAEVHLPPMADMTPTQVSFIKGTGEKGKRLDDGTYEALHLARQSMAMRMMAAISKILSDIPERKKIECPGCCGDCNCPACHGDGCEWCHNSGQCPECHGRGVIVE